MDETQFDKQIHDALEHVELDPKSEERILQNLLSHESKGVQQHNNDTSAPNVKSDADKASSPSTTPKRKHSRARVILPIAACLVVVLIGVAIVSTQFYLSGTDRPLSDSTAAYDSYNLLAIDGTEEDTAESTGTEPEREPDSTAESGNESATGDTSSDESLGASATQSITELESGFAARYPYVTLSSGIHLRVALEDDIPLIADEDMLSNIIEQTQAISDDGTKSVNCTVYATTDSEHPYAIQYADGTCYFADEEN